MRYCLVMMAWKQQWLLAVSMALGCGPKEPDSTSGDASTGGDDSTSVSVDGSTSEASGTTMGTTGVSGDACEVAGVSASRETFDAAREAASGQYWYTVPRGIFDEFGIPACRYTTTIIVDGGVAVERRVVFEEGTADGDPAACTTADFVEVGDQVGTSDAPGVAPAVLLETLYDGCCAEVIHVEPASDYDVIFEVDDAGVMSMCYYLALGCGEGCDGGPMGYGSIVLDQVGFGPPPA